MARDRRSRSAADLHGSGRRQPHRHAKHSGLQYNDRAGISTCKAFLKELRPPKAAYKTHEIDFSLLQPGPGNPDVSLRLDPAAFNDSAGALAKLHPLFENGKPSMTRLQHSATDPITHFRHDGDRRDKSKEYMKDAGSTKRIGYTSKAAASSWTFVHDAKLSEAMKRADIKPEVLTGADGVRHYNIWGKEDLRMAATKDLIKCERAPDNAHIMFNDMEQLPYCLREGLTGKRPVHGHWQSSRVWQAMKDEPYMKEIKNDRQLPDDAPGRHRKHYQTRLDKMKEMQAQAASSDDEGINLSCKDLEKRRRKPRSARSLPPPPRERNLTAGNLASSIEARGMHEKSFMSGHAELRHYRGNHGTYGASVGSASSGSVALHHGAASQEVHETHGQPRARSPTWAGGKMHFHGFHGTHGTSHKIWEMNSESSGGGGGQQTARSFASAGDARQQSATPRPKSAPASETSSRASRTPGGASPSMSSVTITNAWAAARRNSAPKNAKARRDSTPPPSMNRPK